MPLATWRASVGSLLLSRMISSICRPSRTPSALICSATSSTALWSAAPWTAAGPDSSMFTPILMLSPSAGAVVSGPALPSSSGAAQAASRTASTAVTARVARGRFMSKPFRVRILHAYEHYSNDSQSTSRVAVKTRARSRRRPGTAGGDPSRPHPLQRSGDVAGGVNYGLPGAFGRKLCEVDDADTRGDRAVGHRRRDAHRAGLQLARGQRVPDPPCRGD